MDQTEQPEPERLGFRSQGSWSAADLSLLTASVDGIYNALLTTHVERRLENDLSRTLDMLMSRYEKYLDHPFYFEMLHSWRDLLRLWRKTRGKIPLPLPMFPFQATPFDLGTAVPDSKTIYTNLAQYSGESERLRIHRIRMASPGLISFEGLGDIVREFRELIKDMWYRNRQEKQRGDQESQLRELEIVEKYLGIGRQFREMDIPFPTILVTEKYLSDETLKNINNLRKLEQARKLKEIPKNLDVAK